MNISNYLSFSDTAKFALIAKKILENGQFTTTFNFWNHNFFNTSGILPIYPYLLSLFFNFFRIRDISILISSFTFFVLGSIFIYLLTSKLSNKFVGLLSSIVFLFSPQMIEFAKNGASEVVFIFEILLGLYFITLKNKWSNIGAVVTMILLYFTRSQAFIYILGLIIFYFFNNLENKKAILCSIFTFIVFIVLDLTIFAGLEGKFFIYSMLSRGVDVASNNLPNMAVSDSLRGVVSNPTVLDIFKKVFYNLYNFYKALPEIINPYMFTLFVLGLFSWGKNKLLDSFKIASLFMIITTFFVTALTIPFYRYIHPIIPLVYIIAVITLYEIVEYLVSRYEIIKNKQSLAVENGKKIFTGIVTTCLVLFFAVGQTVGHFVLDSRFERKIKNVDKPPIYVLMSWKLKEITNKDQVVLTNLDTWGSWYGERKTIWYPVEPEMIIPEEKRIDAIYLTSYKMDDENYYMGQKWRELFENPERQTILPNYKFVGEYEFSADDNYERESGRSILLVKN